MVRAVMADQKRRDRERLQQAASGKSKEELEQKSRDFEATLIRGIQLARDAIQNNLHKNDQYTLDMGRAVENI